MPKNTTLILPDKYKATYLTKADNQCTYGHNKNHSSLFHHSSLFALFTVMPQVDGKMKSFSLVSELNIFSLVERLKHNKIMKALF